jgi:hypothetical protein
MKEYLLLILAVVAIASCTTGRNQNQTVLQEPKEKVHTNTGGKGPEISVELFKGEAFYYPLIAIWLEDENGKYIQTLYVAKSVATGVFKYGKQENNKWIPSSRRAPQSLPYWAHKRNILASDGLYVPDYQTIVPDAYSGATPTTGFILTTKADSSLPEKFRVLMEINQNWDWNEYWTNNKYPDDIYYKMSCQPALVYESLIETKSVKHSYKMVVTGHSHYSGKTGELFPDLSTLTTALHIADSVIVRIK